MEKLSRIKVMHLILSLETGGMEKFVYDICLSTNKNKFNVCVCCILRYGQFAEKLIDNGFEIRLFNKRKNELNSLFILRLAMYLRGSEIDVLHIHSGAFFYGSTAGFFAGVNKIIYTEHGRHFPESKKVVFLDKISSLFCHKIVTVSNILENYLVHIVKLNRSKIITILNGVDSSTFKPRSKPEGLLREFDLDCNCKIIGFVGRLSEVKNICVLIKAYKIILENFKNSKLIIVGSGNQYSSLMELVRELNLCENVIFAGNRDDIYKFYNLFDIFSMTSLMEGTSLSLLEAMSSGLPSVVTNVGGNTKIITNGVNGCLVNGEDYMGIALSVLNLLNNDILYNTISCNSRNFVVDHHSLSATVRSYEKVYLGEND